MSGDALSLPAIEARLLKLKSIPSTAPPAPRRLRNELYSGTATRAGVCSVPQMKIPLIDADDPGAAKRSQRLLQKIDVQEAKLNQINKNSYGIGKRAVTCELLKAQTGNGTEFLPRQQLVTGGKPFICQPLQRNEVPTFAGDALFTTTNRAEFYWKLNIRKKKKKHRRPYDEYYKFRDSFCMQKACLRD